MKEFDFKFPKRFKWFAVDSNGDGFVYTTKPKIIKRLDCWNVPHANEDDYIYVGRFKSISKDWKSSLQKRS